MKNAGYILGGLLMLSSIVSNGQELAPDQNPNYMNSAEKYAAQADELTVSQSTTVQDTYKAYDWREAKAEKKEARLDRKYELRKLRYQSRNRCNSRGGYYGRSNRYNGYNNNNNGYYNNGCNNNRNYGTNLLYGAGLGLGLYHILN